MTEPMLKKIKMEIVEEEAGNGQSNSVASEGLDEGVIAAPIIKSEIKVKFLKPEPITPTGTTVSVAVEPI